MRTVPIDRALNESLGWRARCAQNGLRRSWHWSELTVQHVRGWNLRLPAIWNDRPRRIDLDLCSIVGFLIVLMLIIVLTTSQLSRGKGNRELKACLSANLGWRWLRVRDMTVKPFEVPDIAAIEVRNQ